jgi:ribose transport system permease protein
MKILKKAATDYRIPLLAALLFLVMALIKPNFASTYNIYSIADSAAGYGIAAIGFTFILLVGQLDISFGSVIALTACVLMMMLKAGMNFALALAAALVLGCVCGAITGFFVAKWRLSPFIVTMTMQLVYKGIALTITNSSPVAMQHPVLKAIYSIKLFNMIPLTFLFFIVLALLMEFVLRRTQYGRNLFLVGGNISAADNLGIKSGLYIWSTFTIQGLFAAIAGVAMMTRQFSASGNLALQGPLNVIPMVIVGGTSMAGGKGGVIKTVWGILLMNIVFNAMTMFSIPAPLQPFVKGLILLIVIVSDKYMEHRHEKV